MKHSIKEGGRTLRKRKDERGRERKEREREMREEGNMERTVKKAGGRTLGRG